jgi:hypothetical protein
MLARAESALFGKLLGKLFQETGKIASRKTIEASPENFPNFFRLEDV